MNAMERVWTRMKVSANKSADRKTLIGMRESRSAVLKLCRQEKANTPPRDALQYLAKELVRLTLRGAVSGCVNLCLAERSERQERLALTVLNIVLILKNADTTVLPARDRRGRRLFRCSAAAQGTG